MCHKYSAKRASLSPGYSPLENPNSRESFEVLVQENENQVLKKDHTAKLPQCPNRRNEVQDRTWSA